MPPRCRCATPTAGKPPPPATPAVPDVTASYGSPSGAGTAATLAPPRLRKSRRVVFIPQVGREMGFFHSLEGGSRAGGARHINLLTSSHPISSTMLK